MGAGIGGKVSGGWTTNKNKNESRLARLEKLQALANPECFNFSEPQKQQMALQMAESLIESNIPEIDKKRKQYVNLGKIRVQKGIKDLKEKILVEQEEKEKAKKLLSKSKEKSSFDIDGPNGQRVKF